MPRTKRTMLGITATLAILLMAMSPIVQRVLATTMPEASRANQVRELNNEVLGIHGLFQEAAANGAGALRSQAAKALSKRAAALAALIQEDPGQALSFAFSPELLSDLSAKFPESASLLETRGAWQGPMESWVMDYLNG